MKVFLNGLRIWKDVEDCGGEPEFAEGYLDKKGNWKVPCSCCSGHGDHPVGKGPDKDSYSCETCLGFGEWRLVLPKGRSPQRW